MNPNLPERPQPLKPSKKIITITPEVLSPLITSICGILVPHLLSPSEHQPDIEVDSKFVPTNGAVEVLRKLALNIQYNRPVMLHGKAGAGKTFLINQLAQYMSYTDSIVKIHLGEQTDAKLLLGTYASGEKPGTFEWRTGVLTSAVQEGKWVLIEDIDKAPTEVLSVLLTLLEKRELSIPSRGEVIKAKNGFQLFSTIRTSNDTKKDSVPDLIGVRLWELIKVEVPNEVELKNILITKFPLLTNLINSFIKCYNEIIRVYSLSSFVSLNKGSHPRVISFRDLIKFCARCNNMLMGEGITKPDEPIQSTTYYNLMEEAIECYCSAITTPEAMVPLVNVIGETLEIPTSRINLFLSKHVPTFINDDEKLKIGRATLKKAATDKTLYTKRSTGNNTSFARTNHSLRLMEEIGVAIEMVEPVLLVGETGTGKTTVVQQVAKLMNKKLTVINVSQQTETGDLLGGYKPVNTKTVAVPIQDIFDNLFLGTFSEKKNAKFSKILAKCFNKNQWKNVVKLWREALKMAKDLLAEPESDEQEEEDGAPRKKRKLQSFEKSVLLEKWLDFEDKVRDFEIQATTLDNSFVFNFVEGSLVKAVKNGDWLLLDELNLATSDTLESIADLLADSVNQRSILLSERGDVQSIKAHPEFRIFGCMNPSTDVGKKDLPLSIRSRFTEIYVHSPDRDIQDLLAIIDKYIGRFAVGDEWVGNDIAELYMKAKTLAETNKIVDGANQKPHFSIRTLTRTLIYVCDIVSIYGLRRSLFEGFSMAFLTLLDGKSEDILKPEIIKYTIGRLKNAKSVMSQIPPAPTHNADDYVQFKHYWMKHGPQEIVPQPHYIITPFVEKNMLNLVRATAGRRFPVLIQGPTSAGKTSMINYLANITGHKFVRINNHEHTDLQEYLGTYISDSTGKLVFKEGVLVEALRKGHWIVLDELNLAPTDVLEALNRLLDDNRELFIPETQEVVHPHPDFMLFATQNPPGLYGGRKVLSRAFRNRFLELHFDDIPQDELEIILKERCQIAPSYGKKIVEVYRQLSIQRQSTRLFEQKNSFATLRDLFRWAMREAVGYEELAANGYMLLAERVRKDDEKELVKKTIEKVMKVQLDMDAYYKSLEVEAIFDSDSSIVWTKTMRRLAVLVSTSIKYKEPLLLVGETGCGKTTVCQIIAKFLNKELVTVNAHQNTETGDLLGAQRPVRNRNTKEKSTALFEWCDGPLVRAMKSGDFFLLDEISLADDSVLERLNSVLEPERSLLLAEKGTDDAFITAEETFEFLATMNPGGDYGKKELSPALRNRFTEIWVPSMEDFNDVHQIVESRIKHKQLTFAVVQFSEWYAKSFGGGHTNNGIISLRDILAWVEFINSCHEEEINPLAALYHGASMVFIDALGTNNTAYLAENEARLQNIKKECVDKLSTFAEYDLSEFATTKSQVIVSVNNLTAGLFSIPTIEGADHNKSFNLDAPTTAVNAMRVVRAMQVHKPILLEGSPGVGKTSLVTALASATGNPLVRINLSEQTDLVDLFGSDAPAEGGKAGEFVWRDAPFLRAMQRGEWVLLDEMNLASQSVLEGLNACLDHRGEAYIPELDKSFKRHPNFTVFAAQNPQYQGGGRKGLPKSFVNRFTVVYVDTLKSEDLNLISQHLFPSVNAEECSQLIEFMSKLEEEVVTKKLWGSHGSPWEFNLRDSLRWLSLYTSGNISQDIKLSDFINMIICQRFRNTDDRVHAQKLFESFFGPVKSRDNYFQISELYVQAGGALVPRKELIQYVNGGSNLLPLQCNFEFLETAFRCVTHNLPLILTGPTNSGKTDLVRYLANTVGAKLDEFSMNSDVDSMDILGGYEQVDLTRAKNKLLDSTCTLLKELIIQNQAGSVVIGKALALVEFIENNQTPSFEQFHNLIVDFAKSYSSDQITKLVSDSDELLKKIQEEKSVKFEWFDGLLVQAVEKGNWLVLDNANLCSPSVLDRLNSLLETNGSLIINECSLEDGQPRILKPHPNFRLFLTMDPKYGELSRAMRNRGIEVFMNSLESRVSSYDSEVLGVKYSQEGNSSLTDKIEELSIKDITIVPTSVFNFDKDTLIRSFSLMEDAFVTGKISSSALWSFVPLANFEILHKWKNVITSSSEFDGSSEIYANEICEALDAFNQLSILGKMKELYSPLSEASTKITGVDVKFVENQSFHPLSNIYVIASILQDHPEIKSLESTMIFETLGSIIQLNNLVTRIETLAMDKKVHELSFIEKSAAVHLGREIKSRPRLAIYSFVKKLVDFIGSSYFECVNNGMFTDVIYQPLHELCLLVFGMVETANGKNESKLRVYQELIVKWSQKYLSANDKLMSQFKIATSSFAEQLELTTGFAMNEIWEYCRGQYPQSFESWGDLQRLYKIMDDFDTLSKVQFPESADVVSSFGNLVGELYQSIISGQYDKNDLAEMLVKLETGISELATVSESFTVERVNAFIEDFTNIANFIELAGKNNDQLVKLYTFSERSMISLVKEDKFKPYPGIFDSLWIDNKSKIAPLFTSDLIVSVLSKTLGFSNTSGKLLDQANADLRLISKSLIEHSSDILQDSRKTFSNLLLAWFKMILKALGITENYSSLELVLEEVGNVFGQESKITEIFTRCFIPAIVIVTTPERPSLQFLGRAWILFSCGLIQLYVPSSPYDPAIKEYVIYKVYEDQKKYANDLISSWKAATKVQNGDQETYLESTIMELDSLDPPSNPRVYRDTKSIDGLFDEWNSIMESTIDVEPVEQLLASAVSLSEMGNTSSNKIEMFQNNTSQFIMRLNKNYLLYSDLNDILRGYIYGLKLGFELLSVDKNQGKFLYSEDWSIDVGNFTTLESLEKCFPVAKDFSKTVNIDSPAAEYIMNYFMILSFNYPNKVADDVLVQALQQLYYRWSLRRMKEEQDNLQQGSLYKYSDPDEDIEGDFKKLFPDFEDVLDVDTTGSKKNNQSFESIYEALATSYVKKFLLKETDDVTALVSHGSELIVQLRNYKDDLNRGQNSASGLSSLVNQLSSTYSKYNQAVSSFNFYQDSNPGEVKRAVKIMTSVNNFAKELLLQWEENSILKSIQFATHEFLNYRLGLPLGRYLQKLEQIYTFIAEWQKYASKQVSMQDQFDMLTNLIVSWRKLELSTWKSLFKFEEESVERNIGKWWFYLLEVIIIPLLGDSQEEEDEPAVKVISALNVFMSKVTYGEFKVRLNLLKSFRNHAKEINGHHPIVDSLANFLTFYEQFESTVVSSIEETKKKLEKDINEVILLASWKDVNIDALKQSARKSHNNLYKIVRKYRSLLSTSVQPIIEQGINESSVQSTGKFKDLPIVQSVVVSGSGGNDVIKSIATWAERPKRLQDLTLIENNMNVYVERISSEELPDLLEFTSDLVSEMERLKKETPSELKESNKKLVAALKNQKRKLLSDTIKEIRRSGLKTSFTSEVLATQKSVNLIISNSVTFSDTLAEGSDTYFYRILDLLPRLRAAIGSGNEEVPHVDLEKGLSAIENLIHSLIVTRVPMKNLATNLEVLNKLYGDFYNLANLNNLSDTVTPVSLKKSITLNIDNIKAIQFWLPRLLDYAITTLESIGKFGFDIKSNVFYQYKVKLSDLKFDMDTSVYSDKTVEFITTFSKIYYQLIESLKEWALENPKFAFVSDVLLTWINNNTNKVGEIENSTSLASLESIESAEVYYRNLTNSIILSVQKIIEIQKQQSEITMDDDNWLVLAQHKQANYVKNLHLKNIISKMSHSLELSLSIEHNSTTSKIISSLASFTYPILNQYIKLVFKIFDKSRMNYYNLSKSTYILSSSLYTLSTKGFCSPQPPNESKDDDTNLHDGTGLGDGEGAQNNSNDVEDDEDLSEQAQQPNEEKKDKDDGDEEENDDAVDIEGDMAGDLEEASDQDNDDDDDEEKEDEDLDEEIDDIDDLDSNAIDEKMWDEEVKEEENKKEKDSDKVPENSNNDDEMEAMEDDEDENKDNNQPKDDDKNQNDKEGDDEKEEDGDEGDDEKDVGEQEDDVKNEENEQLEDHVPETETLELPEDMNLDGDDEDIKEEEEDNDDKFDDNLDDDEEDQTKAEEDEKSRDVDEEMGDDDEEEGEDEDETGDAETGENEINEDAAEQNEEEQSDDETVGEDLSKPDDEEKGGNDLESDQEQTAEGVEGANDIDTEDVDMDSAVKQESGEKGEGADNQIMEENQDIGASGNASSEQQQDQEKQEEKEPPVQDDAREKANESIKQLGDSLKEFHRRRQEILESNQAEKEEKTDNSANEKPDEFQHIDGENADFDTQALGAADKDQVQSIDEDKAIDDDDDQDNSEQHDIKQEDQPEDEEMKDAEEEEEVNEANEENPDVDFEGKSKSAFIGERKINQDEDDMLINSKIDEQEDDDEDDEDMEEIGNLDLDDEPPRELDEARDLWKHSELATQELASGLCEQLRLILEPTLATKLRGDYKTGKRLNMKRIIPYIASDFKKDKIWLRRTKPSKRQYQIMIAVDDSKSMSESKSTELAFHSIALVSKALSQLESGGLSIVRFGEDVKVVHPFDKPFNSQETGARIFQWFDFQQVKTDMKQLCNKSFQIFEDAQSSSQNDLWQLQIILSDGVCEDHETILRMVRKAREEKIMMVFVVIDGINNHESIMDMQQVSYVTDPNTGQMNLKVDKYLDSFPFEFFVVVKNINELPEMLALILRQYFSEVSSV
ncbi:MDN1 Midasin [Candida maltosa Xu316]